MADFQQKNGTGTLWKNDKYEQGGNQPYAKGKVLDLNGNEFEVALWIPKSDKIKGFNITMQVPYKKEEAVAPVDIVPANEKDTLPF